MAYTSGTANNYRDLLDKFYTFVTSDSELVSINQQWSSIRWTSEANSKELILKAPGLSGSDEIYCGIKTYQDDSLDYYMWDLNGYVGYSPSTDFYGQPGSIIGDVPKISLSNSSITYWFIVSGRRAVIVAKVSTIFQVAYLGFIRPYMSPNQYPYPIMVGGSMTGAQGLRYDVTGDDHRIFFDPGGAGLPSDNTSCMLRSISGEWMPFQNHYNNSLYNGSSKVWPYCSNFIKYVRDTPFGHYSLIPITLSQYRSAGDHNIFGEIEGCFHISGFGNTAGNYTNQTSYSYPPDPQYDKIGLIVQNVYRTSVEDYCVILLDDASYL